jgi:hypothetical protein
MRERGPPDRARWARVCAAALAVALALAAAATRAGAEGAAQVLCRAERAGDRARTELTVIDLFDRDLLRLVRLGLEGRIAVEAILYRRRPLWFDQRLGSETRTQVVAWSRARRTFTLDGVAAEPARMTLAPVVLRAAASGAHYVEVSVRLEVVTAGSLVQVARWLVRGENGAGEGATPSLLGRSLLSQVAADLARTAQARCPVR